MTMFGKVLVFVNLALSLIFAAWALGVYTQRVDWTDKKKDQADERTWGRTAKLKDEIDRWHGSVGKPGPRPLAETRWLSSLADLRTAEKRRKDNQTWYAEQVAALEKSAAAEPVKRVVTGPGGVVQLDKGLPKLEVINDRAGQPLKARQALRGDHAKLVADIDETQKAIRVLSDQATKLTDEMLVLFRELERAAQAREGAGAEQRFLEQLLYNTQVEADLLLDRQKDLEARLTELKMARATSQARGGQE